jgi:hypothetical protein
LLGPDETGSGRRRSWADEVTSGRLVWERLVEISSRHLVTPALLTAFDSKNVIDLIPDDFRRFLIDMRTLNIQRNQEILGQLMEIGRALNQEGIEPIPLKGAAHLLAGLYGSLGDRVLGDLDVLIPAEAARECYLILVKLGYQGHFQTAPGDPYHGHHHLPPLGHPARRAYVELHTGPVNKRYQGILDADDMTAEATAHEIEGVRLRLPSLTHQMIHNILHFRSTIHHLLWNHKPFPLRDLHDLSLIRRAAGDGIDWLEVRDRFERGGQGRALRIHLDLAERFLGQSRPEGFSLPFGDRLARAWFLYWAFRQDRPGAKRPSTPESGQD